MALEVAGAGGDCLIHPDDAMHYFVSRGACVHSSFIRVLTDGAVCLRRARSRGRVSGHQQANWHLTFIEYVYHSRVRNCWALA